jgi:hypothetical protein
MFSNIMLKHPVECINECQYYIITCLIQYINTVIFMLLNEQHISVLNRLLFQLKIVSCIKCETSYNLLLAFCSEVSIFPFFIII